MKKFLIIAVIIIAVFVGAFALITWRAKQNATAMLEGIETEAVLRDSLSSVVGATGTVRANQTAYLEWKVSGQVGLVLPSVGEPVAAGDTLAAISENSLPAQIILAQADLLNYERELEALLSSSVQQAEAQKAVETAERALQDAMHPELAQAQALAAVAVAQDSLDEAEKQLAIITNPVSQDAIDQAYANMILAENRLNKTLDSIEKLEKKRLGISSSKYPPQIKKRIARALKKGIEGLEFKRTQDQLVYNRSVTKYENLLEPPEPLDIAVAQAAVFAAQAQLDDARLQYARIENGYSPAEVAVLEAQLAEARQAYERIKDSPPADEIAVLQANIAASQAAIDQVEIAAPFSGTITSVEIQPGDQVEAGTPAFRLDDLSLLLVDINVSEIDINQVRLGQSVVLTFDGVLAKEYHGTVVEVASVGTENQGVTTYQVTVELLDADEDVRPEMTAAVDIITSEVDDVLLVPNRAIRLLEGERVVYILSESPDELTRELDENTAGLGIFSAGESLTNAFVPVRITLGASSALYSEVISGDLEEGDVVVLNPPADGLARAGGNAITVEINP